MEKEFTPYEQALALKELGFDEPCFRAYHTKEKLCVCSEIGYKNSQGFGMPTAPLYQQAFRWFREKHDLRIWIESNSPIEFYYTIATSNKQFSSMVFEDDIFYNTHKEVELECLKKLIEIVKQK